MIDAGYASRAIETLERSGYPTTPLLKQLRIDRDKLSDPDGRIAFRQHVAVLEAAAVLSGDALFGLHLGEKADPRDAGLLGYIAVSSNTVGHALKNVVRYEQVHTEGDKTGWAVNHGFVTITNRITDPVARMSRQHTEFALRATLEAIRIVTRTTVVPVMVEFEHSTEHQQAIGRAFGATVHFERPHNALIFEEELLKRPIVSSDSRLLHYLEEYCKEILVKRPKMRDPVYRVQELIGRFLSAGYPTIDRIARELGVSARTLSRRLQAQGISYRGIVDDLRKQLAIRYLQDEQLALSQIAYLLGYSELSAFNHAFRRWTGQSPSLYRVKVR